MLIADLENFDMRVLRIDDFVDLLFSRSGYLRNLRIWWFEDLKIWIANFEGVDELRISKSVIWRYEDLIILRFSVFLGFVDLGILKISGTGDLRIWWFCLQELVICGFWGFGNFEDLKNLRIRYFKDFVFWGIWRFDLRIWGF